MSDRAATKFFDRWTRESGDRYRQRMRKVWDAESAPAGKKFRYSAYFDATLSLFGEVLMAIGPLPLDNVRIRAAWSRGRYGIEFDADFQTWQNALAVLKGFPVSNVATRQDEIGDGGG